MVKKKPAKKLLRILIIEDNIDHVELLTYAIERNFVPVDLHTVESIEDALDFIEQTEYDIVFTDCYLNNDLIVDKIPNLRKKLDSVPIIVITGSGDESLAASVIKNGATDYVVKNKTSLVRIPKLIEKYCYKKGVVVETERRKRREAAPIQEKILSEVVTLGRQAKHLSSPSIGRVPDVKQLESLLDQIQRLKELASKLMDK